MENPKVSILVPIYNVEKYLPRCIESVLSQDFRDYELILVDDGSPDQCPQICDEYAMKDKRIKVVHKKNGGLVSARLAGFKVARGEYVMHVDSDDYLLPSAISTLYNEAKEGDYDVVKSRPLREDDNGKRWQESYMINDGEILDTETYILDMLHNHISPYLHSSIYRRTIFSKDIFEKVLSGGITIGEDWVTNMLVSERVNKALVIGQSVYVYFWNNSSMMSSTIISPKLGERVDNVLDEFYNKCSSNIRYEHEVKKIVGLIMANFFWELPYNEKWYHAICEFLESPTNRDRIKTLVDSRYLHFIDSKFLFKLYSRFYSYMTFLLNWKGKRRQVVS